MVSHNMVTTQFELNGFRVTRTLGVVRGIVVRSRFHFRHHPAQDYKRWLVATLLFSRTCAKRRAPRLST